MFILLIWKLHDMTIQTYAMTLHFTVPRRFSAGQWHVTTSLALGNEWQLYAPQCGSWATDVDPKMPCLAPADLNDGYLQVLMAEVGKNVFVFGDI